jgi:hypothetical protein
VGPLSTTGPPREKLSKTEHKKRRTHATQMVYENLRF